MSTDIRCHVWKYGPRINQLLSWDITDILQNEINPVLTSPLEVNEWNQFAWVQERKIKPLQLLILVGCLEISQIFTFRLVNGFHKPKTFKKIVSNCPVDPYLDIRDLRLWQRSNYPWVLHKLIKALVTYMLNFLSN